MPVRQPLRLPLLPRPTLDGPTLAGPAALAERYEDGGEDHDKTDDDTDDQTHDSPTTPERPRPAAPRLLYPLSVVGRSEGSGIGPGEGRGEAYRSNEVG